MFVCLSLSSKTYKISFAFQGIKKIISYDILTYIHISAEILSDKTMDDNLMYNTSPIIMNKIDPSLVRLLL